MQQQPRLARFLWIWWAGVLGLASGCTSIDLAPDLDPTGMEQYVNREEQFQYDNFMLGRLKYTEPDPDIDLVTIAFIDARSNRNGRLDEDERNLIKEFREQQKIYFSVGCPIYNPTQGREVGDKDQHLGVPTCNPLDYFVPEDRPMWKGLSGCYLEFNDATRFFRDNSGEANPARLWGIIEVDFSPLTYGKPVVVTQVWKMTDMTQQRVPLPLKIYQVKPEVCKLLEWNFKIIYMK